MYVQHTKFDQPDKAWQPIVRLVHVQLSLRLQRLLAVCAVHAFLVSKDTLLSVCHPHLMQHAVPLALHPAGIPVH
jgi:hypothetical protein